MKTMKDDTMDFIEYFETGEETPEPADSLSMTDYHNSEFIVDTENDSLSITDKNVSEEKLDLNEGLVDVIFKTLKTNMKVNVQGNLVYFRWEWLLNKTFFTIRMRKSTLDGFVNWITKIQKYADEE